MSRTVVSVNGKVDYSRSTGDSDEAALDTKNAVIYITASGIKYGIIINIYRKNNTINYDKAEMINVGANTITTQYSDGYATIKGQIQLKYNNAVVGALLNFTKTFAVENDVTGKSLIIDSQSSSISNLGASYKKITIYANIHY